MPNVQKAIIAHAVRTNQINLQDEKLSVSNNVSKAVLSQLNAQGIGAISPGGIIDFEKIIIEGGGPPVSVKYILEAQAQQKIEQKYTQLGGKNSPLGLPIKPELGVRTVGNAYIMDYRGGQILMENNQIVATKMREIEVWWTGLECRVRQESVDEVYGTVAVIIPGSGLQAPHKFPADREYLEMGPDGQRILSVAVLLYKGPPMDIALIGSLVEHDSGNIDKYKQKVSDVIAKAAAGLAGMAGVPAEATAASSGWINDLSGGLTDAAFSALGADDDQYIPQTKLLHWDDILTQNYTRNTLHRSDDGNSLQYTHSLSVSGVDQGGDRGEYAFYFDIRSFDIVPVRLP